jgi:hypothetical protein
MRRFFTLTLAVLALAALVTPVQAQDTTTRVLSLSPATTDTELRDFSNFMRAIVQVNNVAPDAAGIARSLTVQGTPDEVALAEWLTVQINAAPSSIPATVSYDYKAGKNGATAVRIMYFPRIASLQTLTDTSNAIRAVALVNNIFPLPSRSALGLRATPAQAELVEWIAQELEGSRATDGQHSAVYQCPPENRLEPYIRVFRLGSGVDTRALVEVTNAVRLQTKSNTIFPYPTRASLVMRGSTEQLTQAEAIIQAARTPGR